MPLTGVFAVIYLSR